MLQRDLRCCREGRTIVLETSSSQCMAYTVEGQI